MIVLIHRKLSFGAKQRNLVFSAIRLLCHLYAVKQRDGLHDGFNIVVAVRAARADVQV